MSLPVLRVFMEGMSRGSDLQGCVTLSPVHDLQVVKDMQFRMMMLNGLFHEANVYRNVEKVRIMEQLEAIARCLQILSIRLDDGVCDD